MMIRLIAVLLLLTTSSLTSARDPQPEPAGTYDNADAYDVLSALLTKQLQGDKTVIIAEQTSAGDVCVNANDKSDAIIAETIADHIATNRKSWRLQPLLRIPVKYRFLSSTERDEIFRNDQDGWKAFHDRYPDVRGFYSVSAVGFNVRHTLALVQLDYSCGWLCGQGRSYFLEKKDGKWRPYSGKHPVCKWIS